MFNQMGNTFKETGQIKTSPSPAHGAYIPTTKNKPLSYQGGHFKDTGMGEECNTS